MLEQVVSQLQSCGQNMFSWFCMAVGVQSQPDTSSYGVTPSSAFNGIGVRLHCLQLTWCWIFQAASPCADVAS